MIKDGNLDKLKQVYKVFGINLNYKLFDEK